MFSLNKVLKSLFVLGSLLLLPVVFSLTTRWSPPVSIFHLEYESVQAIIRKTNLYPTVFLARAFQNKTQIPITKYEHNLTALLDPNNYFFGYHPREIFGGDNAVKFPFVALPFFLFGFYVLPKTKNGRLLIILLTSSILLLSLVNNYAVYEFLLYFPLAYVFLLGLRNVPKWFKKFELPYLLIGLPFAILESLRQIIELSLR